MRTKNPRVTPLAQAVRKFAALTDFIVVDPEIGVLEGRSGRFDVERTGARSFDLVDCYGEVLAFI